MTKKKFDEYDMRDNFSFPVYVGFNLKEFNGIKGIDPDKRFAGELTRVDGKTSLDLSIIPTKEDYKYNGVIHDEEDKVMSQEDTHDWYATTWDGNYLFVLHKFFRVQSHLTYAFNRLTGGTSRWLITDFRVVSQFMLSEYVYQARLYLDYVYSWFHIVRPGQDFSSTKPIVYNELYFKNLKFSLYLVGEGKTFSRLHSVEKTAQLCILVNFEQPQEREAVYHLAVIIRNMLQILIGKKTGIFRIILNRNQSLDPNRKVLLGAKDERENWFLDQSFLPMLVKKETYNSDTPFSEIHSKFRSILVHYLHDEKLQALVVAFLTVDHFNIPVDTAIVTLISGVESYYNQATYENGKKIENAEVKLKRFVSLLDNPQQLIANRFRNQQVDVEALLNKLRDSRDYFIHGDKADKFISEADLVPDLIIFRFLYQKILTRLITLEVKKNN